MRFLAWLTVIVAISATWAPLAHVLELPNKVKLDGTLWLSVQQHLYNGWGPFVGAPTEIAGLILSFILAVQTRKDAVLWRSYAIAAAMYVGMLLSFFLLNDPVNRAFSSWTPSTLPADWAVYRMKWETGHAFAALFSILALIAAVLALARIERRSVSA